MIGELSSTNAKAVGKLLSVYKWQWKASIYSHSDYKVNVQRNYEK